MLTAGIAALYNCVRLALLSMDALIEDPPWESREKSRVLLSHVLSTLTHTFELSRDEKSALNLTKLTHLTRFCIRALCTVGRVHDACLLGEQVLRTLEKDRVIVSNHVLLSLVMKVVATFKIENVS